MEMETTTLRDLEERHRKHFVNSKLYTLIQLVLGAATFFMMNAPWYYALAAAVVVWFVAGLPRIIVFRRQNNERNRLLDTLQKRGEGRSKI